MIYRERKNPVRTDRFDLKVCNCAGCGKELLSRQHAEYRSHLSAARLLDTPPLVHGRIADRPYCTSCYKTKIGRPS